VPYAGTTAPEGSLLCFGQAISRTDYVGLFTAISTTYGAGDGSTTFNVPDLRGAVAAGKADMGGSDKGNLSGGTVLGAALGAQNSNSVSGPSGIVILESAFNVPVQAANNAHVHTISVLQPTIVLSYIIKM
jgi:microcystin-dependent protein